MTPNCWDEAICAMQGAWGRDTVFALATRSAEDEIHVRNVDGYYMDGDVYVVTHTSSHKMHDVAVHKEAGLCQGLSVAQGTAENLGHPRDPELASLRDTLRKVFESFYDKHNNEDDPGMCFLRIRLTKAVFFAGGKRYEMDFATRTASSSRCEIDIVMP